MLETEVVHGPGLPFLFKTINFLILALLLFFLLRRPVRDFFLSRTASLRSLVDAAASAQAQALKDHRDIQARLAAIEKETQALMVSFREEGESGSRKILSHAQELTAQMKEEAGKFAEVELQKAKESLRDLTARLVRESGERLIREQLSDQDEESLRERYLEKLKQLH